MEKGLSWKPKLRREISYIFTNKAYDYLNQIPADLRELTKK